jgi:hypothetical protein
MFGRRALIWYRYIRIKFYFWLVLVNAIFRFDCNDTEIYFRLALGRINFIAIYDILDDLIRFPLY